MRSYKKAMMPFLVLIAMMAVTALANFRVQKQSEPSKDQQQNVDKAQFESQFPLANYNEPEPSDPEKHAQRLAKSKRYDGEKGDINENSEVVFSSRHWADGLPALPLIQSHAVVLGTVKNAEAFVTGEKTAIYSEFTIDIERVLKNDSPHPLSLNEPLVIEREGGRVRLPSGRIALSYTNGMGMPRVGKRYVFFLTHKFPEGVVNEEDFYILTAYELNAGKVYPVDSPGGGKHPLSAKYRNAAESSFINDLQSSIGQLSSETPNR